MQIMDLVLFCDYPFKERYLFSKVLSSFWQLLNHLHLKPVCVRIVVAFLHHEAGVVFDSPDRLELRVKTVDILYVRVLESPPPVIVPQS